MKRSGAIVWRTSRSGFRRQRRHFSTGNPEDVQITTLPNRLRVATGNRSGHFSSLGLYVDAGARYETSHTSGVSHFIDRMAFKVLFVFFNRFQSDIDCFL